MKEDVKLYCRSLLYSLGAFIIVSIFSFAYCEYKFVQLRNPEYIRKLIDIELPEFKNVETEEDDDYPINHNSYSIWHKVQFAEPLSKTAVEEIERVCSNEEWSYGNRYGGWGLHYPESEYQYEYIGRNAFRRLELHLSTTKANIYYEVLDSFYWDIIGVLLLIFILWITIMIVWGVTLFVGYIKRTSKMREQNGVNKFNK